MRKTFIIITLFFTCSNSFSQERFNIKGQLISCSDSSKLILGFIHLIQDDTIISTAYTSFSGDFIFNNLKQGTYQIKTDYFFYPSTYFETNIYENKDITLCISEKNSDSLIALFNQKQIFTLYYFGLSKYHDKDLNKIGNKYGVEWKNMGCVSNKKFDKYNKMINKILVSRNGEHWEKKFWLEVEKLHSNKY